MTTSPRVSRKIAPKTSPNPSYRTRLSLQTLEDRVTPASFLVTTPIDIVDPNDGQLSLREAIQQSNANIEIASEDLITFSQSLSGQTITLTGGEMEITGKLKIQGLGASQLTINGNNQSRIFNINVGGLSIFSQVEISGLTLTGGRDTNTDPLTGGGGAIYNRANLVLKDLNLIHNSALGFGGAIRHRGGLPLDIQNCTISGNFAQEGGGIYASSEPFNIPINIIEDSSASDVIVIPFRNLTIKGSTISSNSAVNGGGIRTLGIQLTIESSSILSNVASSRGGGIGASSGGTLSISESTISSNSAASGGGIACFRVYPVYSLQTGVLQTFSLASAKLNLTNSIVSQNVAQTTGGGIWLDRYSGSLILNSKITGNRVTSDNVLPFGEGAGIFNADVGLIIDANGPLPFNRVVNSTVSGNVAGPNNRPSDFGGVPLKIENNVVDPDNEETPSTPPTNNPPQINNPPQTNTSPSVTETPLPTEDPPIQIPTSVIVAIGSSPGTVPSIQIFNAINRDLIKSIQPYSSAFTGGVHVALGDIDDDGTQDYIVGVRSAGAPHIKVFDGKTGAVLRSFYAFDVGFTGGVFLSSADINHDGVDDIIVSAAAKGSPHVKVFSGANGSLIRSFFAYAPNMTAGVRVSAGDVNGDGFADIITSPGAGVSSHVKVFDGKTGTVLNQFFAYDTQYTGGTFVTLSDRNKDGVLDLFTGADSGANPHIKVFNPSTGRPKESFYQNPSIILLGVEVQNSPTNPNPITQPAQFLESLASRLLNNFEALPTLLDRASA